jgi:hypothetical protein
MYVCLTCYNDPTVTLKKSIVMGQRVGPGNVSHHLRRVHGVEPKGRYRGKKKSPRKIQPAPLAPQSVNAQGVNAQPRALPFAKTPASKKQRTEVSPGAKSGKSISPDKASVAGSTLSSKDAFVPMKEKGAKQILDEYFSHVHAFVTNKNIAVRTVTDTTNCPEFKRLIEFTSFRKKQFETLLAAIEMYVSHQARGGYHQLLKKRVPFISVGHDIWDSTEGGSWGDNFFL